MSEPTTTDPREWVIRVRFCATEDSANALADEIVDIVVPKFAGSIVSLGPEKEDQHGRS